MTEVPLEHADVAIVGGGPAGLAAATELARRGAGRVVVLEREAEPGGIPRHANHQGYGLRDLHRSMTGPDYARRRATIAADAGAELRTQTQVTGWGGERTLELTSPRGRSGLEARAVVLATGCRERPRAARLVPGSRPQGVMTTGMLQQVVYLNGQRAGRRAVVVGAEHVSFSALLTLQHGGATPVAMVTDQPHHQSYAAFRAGAAARFRVPLHTHTALTDIRGRRRVEAVQLTDLRSGAAREVECDLVVFTADWIPDHEIAILGDVPLDDGTLGPAVDAGLRTERPGVFAAGNVLHGAETADIAALSGRHVADGVAAHLAGRPWPSGVPIECAPPLHWISPNRVAGERGAGPPRGRFLLRAREELVAPLVELTQDGRMLVRQRLPRVMSGRSAVLGPGWTAALDPAGGPVQARVVSARRRRSPSARPTR